MSKHKGQGPKKTDAQAFLDESAKGDSQAGGASEGEGKEASAHQAASEPSTQEAPEAAKPKEVNKAAVKDDKAAILADLPRKFHKFV